MSAQTKGLFTGFTHRSKLQVQVWPEWEAAAYLSPLSAASLQNIPELIFKKPNQQHKSEDFLPYNVEV